MWFPKSMSWWLRQNRIQRKVQTRRRRLGHGCAERLEERTLLTTTLYLDFGSGIGMGNTLSTTTTAYRDIFGVGDASFGGSYGTGSDLTADLNATASLDFTPLAYDFDSDGDTDDQDITALTSAVVPLIQRALEPFDINIVIASATSFADAVATVGANAGDPSGQFDAYNFIMDIRSDFFGNTSVGDGAPLSADGDRADGAGLFGIAGADDLYKQFFGGPNTNTQDEATLIFSDTILGSTTGTPGTAAFNQNFAQRVAYTVTHEAFHTLTAVHTTGLTASGDVIRLGSVTREDPFMVTRFDLNHGGVAENNNYLLIAEDPDIGLRDANNNAVPDLAYVTGTGAHDVITFSNLGGGLVGVTVAAYSDSAHTALIGSETYQIALGGDTDGVILIDGGINNDIIRIDGTIPAIFRVRGGEGTDGVGVEDDRLVVTGGGHDGTYLPIGSDGGLITVTNGATINVSEIEPAEFSNFNHFTFITPNAVDNLSINSGLALGGQNALVVTGTSGGLLFEVPTFFDVANLEIDTATNDAGGADDQITYNGGISPQGISNVTINTGGGSDGLTVVSTTGLVDLLNGIRFLAGGGTDSLTLTDTTARLSESVIVGASPGQGASVISDGATQTVYFEDIEPIMTSVVATTFTITSNPALASLLDASNSINYESSPLIGPTGGRVTVDNFEPIDFVNKTSLTIDAGAGSDSINLNNPNTPTNLTGITINGGDPTASDTLILNGITGQLDNLRYAPTNAGAGVVVNDSSAQPNVTFSAVEQLELVLQQADGDSVRLDGTDGNDQFQFTPVSASSGILSGTMDMNGAGVGPFAMTPATYFNANLISNDIDINFFGATGGNDSIIFDGSGVDDSIAVGLGEAGGLELRNTVNGQVVARIEAFNLDSALVRGLGGDDIFNHSVVSGVAVSYLGGTPSDSDVLNYNADNNSATMVDLGASTISQTSPAAGVVTFGGIEDVNIIKSGAAGTLVVTGTAGNDVVAFAPTTAGAGKFSMAGNSTEFNYSGASSITANLGGGTGDIVQVLGTGVGDTITSPTASSVAVNGSAVTVGTGVESLEIYGLDGNDTITLGLNLAGIPKTVYGGAGNDVVNMTTTVDATIFGGTGDDTLTGTPLADYISGDEGNDTLNGLDGNDTLLGGDDFDIITISGATPGNDTVSGGTGGDWLLFDPTPATTISLRESAGRVRVDTGANVTLASDISQVLFNSTGANVNLTVHDLSGTSVQRVGVDFNGAGADTLTIEGTSGDDTISLGRELTNPNGDQLVTANLAWGRVSTGVISAAAGDRIVVNGLEGNDTIIANRSVMTTAVVPGSVGDALVTLNGGDGNDVLSVDSPVGQSNNSINGNAGNDAISGGLGNDTFDGGTGDDTFAGNGGTDNTGGGAGVSIGDSILVTGTEGSDIISLGLNGAGLLIATVNGLTTTYANFIGGPVATAGLERILVEGLGGDDQLTVDSTNGALPFSNGVVYNGGTGSDTLTLTGGVATSSTYTVGPNPGDGVHTLVIGGVTQTVSFTGLEPVIDLVGGPLVINANNGANGINYTQGSIAANGLVSIDVFETIEFSNKTTLTINALAGDDTINLNNPNTPLGLTGITVDGGDPTASDTVIVNGTVGNDTVGYNPSATVGAGSVTITGAPTVNFTTTEAVKFNGQGGADTLTINTPAGGNNNTYTPGASYDSGTVSFRQFGAGTALVPLEFSHIGAFGGVTFAGSGAGTDILEVNGTGNSDTFNVTGSTVQIINATAGFTTVLLQTPGILDMALRGLDGDDTFNLTAPLTPLLNIVVDGGNPSASDTLNLSGAAGAIVEDLAAQTVTGYGATVSFLGVEHLNLAGTGGAASLTVNATTGNDQLAYTPTGAAAGTVTRTGQNLVTNFSGIAGAFTLNALGGIDTVTVHGTSASDNINVDRTASTVQVNVLKTVTISSEAIVVAAGLGDDVVNVTGNGAASLTVDGGQPSASDTLNVAAINATVTYGTDPSSGTVNDISFLGIEDIGLTGDGTGTLTVNGTNGDDAINQNGNTVTVNDGATVNFAAYPTLILNGNNGDDTFNVSSATLGGVTTFDVNGGDPTASDTVIVNGTVGADLVIIAASAADTATVTGLGPAININSSEHLTYSGAGGNDSLTVTSPAGGSEITFTPGATADAGSITHSGFVLGGSLLPINYQSLGTSGSLTFDVAGGGRASGLDVSGTSVDDQFDVSAAGTVQISKPAFLIPVSVAINTPGITFLRLLGQDGDDLFNVPGDHPFDTGIEVQGGNPSASDVLNFLGAGAAVAVDFGNEFIAETGFSAVGFTGIEIANVDTAGGDLNLAATGGDDVLSITPTGANAATSRLISSNPGVSGTPVVNGSLIGTLNVDLSGGSDQLVVNGTQGGETVTVNGLLVTVGALETVNYTNAEDLRVAGLGGSDIFNVTPSAVTTISIDGGDPIGVIGDVLNLTATGAVTSRPGADGDEGGFDIAGSQSVSFDKVEDVNVDLAGFGLTAQGTNADDDITVVGRGATAFDLSVNAGPAITYTNATTLAIDALAGDDDIDVEQGVAAFAVPITVTGGASTTSGGDIVTLTGTSAANAFTYAPTGVGTGTVSIAGGTSITFNTTEQVAINGLNGTDSITHSTPAGTEQVTYTPGSASDAGTIATRQAGAGAALVPLVFSQLGAFGNVNFTSAGGREDILELSGTQASDIFNINSPADTVQILNPVFSFVTVVLNTAGINVLDLRGLSGDDTFNLAAALPYAGGVFVDGGDPSASDTLNLSGAAGAIVEDLAAQTVTGYGATVSFLGVEHLNLAGTGGAASLTVNATTGDDQLAYTPTGAAAGTVTRTGQNLVTSFSGIAGAFNVDLLGGSDRLTVIATQVGETITADGLLVTVGGLKTVNFAGVEDLHLSGLSGSDTFNVTPALNTTIFVDGGDPIGSTPGDLLNLFPPAAFVLESGPEVDEGGLRGLAMQRVSWDHIEGITISGPGPAKIVGTNGDDDITVIARDSSTHAGADGVRDFTASVNGGIPVLFLNQATLLIDALAGDDDIVIRAPAPNNAVWNVALTVAGGTPAAATGDQGDVLEYETPGQQTITYTPGATPGTGVINDTTLATSITIAQFLCPVDNLPSSAGSIEQLILDGEGGNDNVTVIGTDGNDTFEQSTGNAVDAGSIAINNMLGLTYEDLGAGATLAIDGSGGNDTLIVNGSSNTDVFGVLANGNVAHAGSLTLTRTNFENVTLRGQDGDDIFNINGGASLTSIQIEGGDPSASDVVNYTATANAATAVDLGASTITQSGPAGATVGLSGVERVNLTSSGGASSLSVTGTAGDDTINVTPTAAGAGSFVRLGLGGSPQFTYTGVGGSFTVDGGSGGFDTLGILGDDAADTVTSTVTTVTIKGGTVTLGAGLDYLNISTFGGNDNVILTGLAIAKTIDAGAGNDSVDLSAAVDATILGGDGDDTLIGSPAADLIYGGAGNDILIGGDGVDHEYGEAGNDQFGDLSLTGNGVADDAGNDFLFGGDGADTFIWEPGDGSDAVQGGDDAGDVLRFLGSAAANAFLLSANSTDPTHFNLALGAATVDTSGVEQVILSALAGGDSVTVSDLTTTEIKAVNIDLGAGDADTVIFNGRNTADDIAVSSAGAGFIDFQGLGYDLNISNATVADTLTVNGNNGDDSIKGNTGVENTIGIIFNGNDGNDYLSADAILNGGNGDDTLVGGVGADTLNGDAGNDILTGNGGADTLNGGTGTDTVVETRDANFTLTDAALTIGAEGTDTLNSIERASLSGELGDNTFNIGLFSGKTTLFGDSGSDTVNFSTATAAINIDMDKVDEDQVINVANRTLVFSDIMENLVATAFNDTIKIDIAPFNRSVDGGLETSIPPGDRLYVDMLGSNPASTKIPNGKLGSFDGTVNGAGVLGTISYVDIETLAIQNPNGGGGPNGGIPIDFGAATDYPVGNGPRGVVAADVNGDGILDMIVANRNSSSVSVRFGNGFGGFGAEAVYSSGTTKKDSKRSITVALGDVDNDGDLDIAVTNRKAGTVGVLLNNGAGVFTTSTFSTGVKKLGKFPMSVKMGDMNNDGNLDIVTTNASVGKKNGSIAILLGNGSGSFGTANTIQTQGRKPRDLVLGDFNGDGNLDVAATNLLSREIVFMAGNGAGGLAAPVSYTVGSQPTSIIAADFNGDGILDLAVTCQTVREISVLMGTGNAVGTFSETLGIKYPNTELEISINSTDLNGDGNADLIIANRATNTLSYMLGLGNGTFDTRVDFKVGGVKGRQPVAIAYGDFNNDGAIDLMVANAGTDDVSVLLRNPIV